MLLHGFMDVASSWDEVADVLAGAGYRVLAPDLRGFGAAPRAPLGSSFYFPDYIADVDALVRESVRPDEALFVVGHSMGGTVATLLAGTYPERVKKLAVLEGLGPADTPLDEGPRRMREFAETTRRYRGERHRTMRDLEEVVSRLRMGHPTVDDATLRAHAERLVTAPADGEGYVWAYDPLHRARSPYPFQAAAFRAFAAAIQCPVLIVSGGPTGFHPLDEDERAGAFRTREIAVIDDAGHMMHWTRPERLAALIVAFFAR